MRLTTEVIQEAFAECSSRLMARDEKIDDIFNVHTATIYRLSKTAGIRVAYVACGTLAGGD
jgi:hypothetical protein